MSEHSEIEWTDATWNPVRWSSGDTIPNCLGELGEIRERTDGGFAGTGRFPFFATCPGAQGSDRVFS
jgi:hypothetical protein